jgi:hypothetical protein
MTAKRVDQNQPGIVLALRAVGATVQHLHKVGSGCPDLLVGFRKKNYLLEIKTVTGKLTPDQVTWHEIWQGKVYVVRDIDDALLSIGAVK